ncbi:MAG: hypothetical protein OEZ34_04245 [Spirochaetia bacterium]|nr:hypothetical protein [Spirochaetia bacterium]
MEKRPKSKRKFVDAFRNYFQKQRYFSLSILIIEPGGNEIASPNLDFLENIILEKGAGYWNSGSGDAGLYYKSLEGACLILVYCKEKNGFYIQFLPEPGASDWDLAINKDKFSKVIVEVSFGGETYNVFEYLIISRNSTLQVVKDFISTGKKSSSIHWESYWEIEQPEIL